MDNSQPAQGFVEVTSYVAAIETADVMVKAADVKIVMAHKVDGPLVCVVCEGDVAACKASVDAGRDLNALRGTLITANVIPRPQNGAGELHTVIDSMKARKAAKKAARSGARATPAKAETNGGETPETSKKRKN